MAKLRIVDQTGRELVTTHEARAVLLDDGNITVPGTRWRLCVEVPKKGPWKGVRSATLYKGDKVYKQNPDLIMVIEKLWTIVEAARYVE